MPFASPPDVLEGDICEATIWGTLCGQRTLTVLHYKFGEGGSTPLDTAMDDLNTKLQEAGGLVAKYRAAAASNFSLDQLVLQVIHPTRWARFVYDINEFGQMSGEALTADLAAVIEKSGFFAASNRALKLAVGKIGMVHFAPVPTEKVSEGLIDQTYLDNELNEVGAAVVNIQNTASGEWIPGIFSARSVAKTFTETNRHTEKNTARVMRRRTVGVGI